MNSFFIALNAVMPMFMFLCFGFLIRKFGLAEQDLLKKFNTLLFKAFFPVLTFSNVYAIDLSQGVNGKMLFLSFALLSVGAFTMMAIAPKFIKENPKRGVFAQDCFRSNYLLFGMALASYVYGEDSLFVVSVALSVIVPTLNVLAVITLERFSDHKTGIKDIAVSVIKNPLIIGVALGFIYNLMGIPTPSFLGSVIKDIASTATPMALIVLGGTLTFSSIKENMRYLVPGLLVKLIILPIIGVGIGVAIGLRGIELFTILSVFASPVAASSYAMSQSMGGDVELAGQFIAFSTVAALFTMFGFIFVLNSWALI